MKKTKKELESEIKELKSRLEREHSKEKCWHCNGSGEYWTYWDGDTHCPYCHGSGRL